MDTNKINIDVTEIEWLILNIYWQMDKPYKFKTFDLCIISSIFYKRIITPNVIKYTLYYLTAKDLLIPIVGCKRGTYMKRNPKEYYNVNILMTPPNIFIQIYYQFRAFL